MGSEREPGGSIGAASSEHTTIAGIWIDVSLEEGYKLGASVSASPVESGADVAHHVRPLPEEVTIKGLISNTPIEMPGSHMDGVSVDSSSLPANGEPALLALPLIGQVPGLGQLQSVASNFGADLRSFKQLSIEALHFTAAFDRVQAVKDALREVVAAGQPVPLVTGFHTYPAVILSELDIGRDGTTGDALHFTVQAQTVRIVDTETGVEVPDPVHPRSAGKSAAGKAAASAVDNVASLNISGAAKLMGL